MTINYDETKEIWEDDETIVHTDASYYNFYANQITNLLKIRDHQRILDIGCGDGDIDHLIGKKFNVQLEGFDFSERLLEKAIEKNPKNKYWNQSFLNKADLNDSYDGVFSFSVLHYCDKASLRLFFENSISYAKKPGIIAHFDIPVIERSHKYFLRDKYSLKLVLKYLYNRLIALFGCSPRFTGDGSIWHTKRSIKKVLNSLGFDYKLIKSWSSYRIHVIINKK